MVERALYIIKPEAFQSRNMVRRIIRSAGLSIVASKLVTLPEWFIDIVYPAVDSIIRDANYLYMRAGKSEVGVVLGNHAIARLLDIAGDEVDPAACKSGTIRRIFGNPVGIVLRDRSYFLNAFHRSRNPNEAREEIAAFQKL